MARRRLGRHSCLPPHQRSHIVAYTCANQPFRREASTCNTIEAKQQTPRVDERHYRYLRTGTLPEDPKQAHKIRVQAARFTLIGGHLYKRSFTGPYLRCLNIQRPCKISQGGASHGRHPGRGGLDRVRHGEGIRGSKEQIQDLRKGVLGSQVQPVSHEEFMSFQGKVISMFTSVESRMEALVACMEARDKEIRQELAIYKAAVSARVMATQEASRVEVPKPHGFSGKRDAKELDNFLWHMERYFKAIALTNEVTKVCRYGERNLHHRDVGGLQEGDQEAFYPEDVAYLARKNMPAS
ncbi:hypothetical protein CK203_076904 [Vitis vinifera]|uniref:Uncharacterized protein n=1 Tax=Vitis vinifera TaxID=29760 RepID=A0A438DZS9_VITVI|nr:hypothetical protein CK203_076904 [Vitis vinifera]